MNQEQVKGRARRSKGKTKEFADKVVGNERLDNDEGRVDQVTRKTQDTDVETKERAKDLIGKA